MTHAEILADLKLSFGSPDELVPDIRDILKSFPGSEIVIKSNAAGAGRIC
jgi:hypothetical protein